MINEKMIGKKFIFGCIAIVCASIVSGLLKYDGKTYLDIIKAITVIFIAGQALTDIGGKK